jgi:serine-type D-Ala-D-Ala carboxypeptidase/endopeptidase
MLYAQLVKDRILNVLGMDSTGIPMNSTAITSPLPDLLKSRLAKGHMGGSEISLAFLPEVIQPSGALYSSTNDLLKYLAANMGLIHTAINDDLQDTHLIRHLTGQEYFASANSSTPTTSTTHNLKFLVYSGLGWRILTNLGSEFITHTGATDGYIDIIGFNPTKQLGLVILCSCDYREVPTYSLNLEGYLARFD